MMEYQMAISVHSDTHKGNILPSEGHNRTVGCLACDQVGFLYSDYRPLRRHSHSGMAAQHSHFRSFEIFSL